MKALMILAGLLLVACAGPPESYSIDTELSPAEVVVVRDAVAAWCDAVGYCPDERAVVDRGAFRVVDHIPHSHVANCPAGQDCQVVARNHDNDEVWIRRNRNIGDDMGAFWTVIAHEIGHYCIDGHTTTGLMAARHTPGEPLEIDDVAIRAWREGCP